MLPALIELVRHAGSMAMQRFEKGVDVSYKRGDVFDPLTQADKAIDVFLRDGVQKILDVPVLSEEHEEKNIDYRDRVWMIDPLDGTKDFVGGSGKFSIMLGLCTAGVPALGVVYLPYFSTLYYAQRGQGSWKVESGGEPQRLTVSDTERLSSAICVGKSQFSEEREIEEKIRRALGVEQLAEGGTVGGILGEIAEGTADVYFFTNPRGGKWDICAPQIILEEAGGKVTDLSGSPLCFDAPGYKLGDGFIASNDLLHEQAVNLHSLSQSL